jgi:hypothetical protein
MADFFDKMGSAAHSALNKGKDFAEVQKLNMDISSNTDLIRGVRKSIGDYVADNHLLAEDPSVSAFYAQIAQYESVIASDREKIRILKNIQICPKCNAEVPLDAKFCPSCGQAMPQPAPAPVQNSSFCPNCGKPLEPGAVFCGYCGAKIEPPAPVSQAQPVPQAPNNDAVQTAEAPVTETVSPAEPAAPSDNAVTPPPVSDPAAQNPGSQI